MTFSATFLQGMSITFQTVGGPQMSFINPNYVEKMEFKKFVCNELTSLPLSTVAPVEIISIESET